MRHGLFFQVPCHDNQSAVKRYEETLYQIELAEELGFDSVWLGEIHFDRQMGTMPSILAMAAAIAQRTRRIRIGMGVSLIPLHNPLHVAEEAAMVDVLSNGRLEFGVGRGILPFYDGFLIPPQQSRERFSEALDIIVKAWTDDRFSYQGRHYKVRDVSLVPRPVQKPYPPITLATSGSSPEVFEYAASQGFDIMSGLFISPVEILRERVKDYRSTEVSVGMEPRSIFLRMLSPTFVAETLAEARQTPKASITKYFDVVKANFASSSGQRAIRAVPEYGKFKESRDQHTYERVIKTEADLYLTPDGTIGRLRSLKEELPEVGEVFHWFEMGGLIPHGKIVKSMKLFAKEVIPHVGFETL